MVQIQLINQVLLWEQRLELEENYNIHHEKTLSQARSLLVKMVQKVQKTVDSGIKSAIKTDNSIYHCCCGDNVQKPEVS